MSTSNSTGCAPPAEWDVLGYSASVFLAFTFVPQLVHTWKVRQVDQISSTFIVSNAIGSGLMLVYGLRNMLLPIVINNSIILLLQCALLALYCKFYNKEV